MSAESHVFHQWPSKPLLQSGYAEILMPTHDTRSGPVERGKVEERWNRDSCSKEHSLNDAPSPFLNAPVTRIPLWQGQNMAAAKYEDWSYLLTSLRLSARWAVRYSRSWPRLAWLHSLYFCPTLNDPSSGVVIWGKGTGGMTPNPLKRRPCWRRI